jgi:predicted Na+-dependent transporter
MEKRILGILLTVLGIAGLIAAAYFFMNGGTGTRSIKSIVIYGLLGVIFFMSGISLIRNTQDKAT